MALLVSSIYMKAGYCLVWLLFMHHVIYCFTTLPLNWALCFSGKVFVLYDWTVQNARLNTLCLMVQDPQFGIRVICSLLIYD